VSSSSEAAVTGAVDQEASAAIPVDRAACREKRKVVHLGKYYFPSLGGIETHVRDLARGQVSEGLSTKVVCINDQSQRRSWGVFSPTSDSQLDDLGVSVKKIARIANILRLDICPGLRHKVRHEIADCDLIHLHLPNPTMLMALVGMRPLPPLVVSWHSDIIKQRIGAKVLRPLETWGLKQASKIIVSNPRYANGSNSLRAFTEKLSVIPFGMPLDPYLFPAEDVAQKAKELAAQWQGPVWLSVGRLVYYKGLHVAIKALKQVAGTLIVVGTGPKEAELKALSASMGVADRIVWLGKTDETTLKALYQIATALWFPSIARSEAFGLVQLEAMASACPVINCDIRDSGVPWVSQDGISGLTVPVESEEQFAKAANRLIAHPALREELASGARARAIEQFQLPEMVDRVSSIYEEVIQAAAPRS